MGIVDAQQFESAHGQSNAQDLTGAQMSVGDFGVAQQFIEGLQGILTSRYFAILLQLR